MAWDAPTDVARRNWASLDEEGRAHAVAWVARSLRRRRIVRRLGSGAVGVGFGLRQQRDAGHHVEILEESVLVVVVGNKWPRRQKVAERGQWEVPRELEIRVPMGRRRPLLALPTDVVTRATPRAQARARGIRATIAGSGTATGTACALIRREPDDGRRYVLSCHHVLLGRPTWQANGARVHADGDLASPLLGTAVWPSKRFGIGKSDSIDAALVRVEDAAGLAFVNATGYWQRVPVVPVADRALLQMLAAGGASLLKRDGSDRLKYVHHLLDHGVAYDGGSVISLSEVVVFRQSDGPHPVAGDSGGPIIAADVLLAMHVAGHGRDSYGIPAYRLFAPSTFATRIALASPSTQ